MGNKLLDTISDRMLYASVAANNLMGKVSKKVSKDSIENLARHKYAQLKGEYAPENEGRLKKLSRALAKYGALTLLAYGGGDLVGDEQRDMLRSIGEGDEAILTKLDVAVIYPITAAIQGSSALASGLLDTKEGMIAYGTNLALSLIVNGYRAKKSFVDGKPVMSFCWQTGPMNLIKKAPKIKNAITEKGFIGASKYAGKKIATAIQREIVDPLHASTEQIAQKSYESLQNAKRGFNSAFTPETGLEDYLAL